MLGCSYEIMKSVQFVILLFAVNLIESYSYNILGVFPHIGKSHFDVFLPLMKGLAEKGHSVTVISNFPQDKPLKNYKDINIGGKSLIWVDVIDMNQIKSASRLDKINNILFLSHLSQLSCEFGLSSSAVQNFLKTKEKYDLMITEFFNSDCFLSLANKVKAPIIGLSSSTLMPWTSYRFANPTHTAYIPNNCMDYSDRMTFYERLENTVVTLYHQFYYDYFMLSQDERIARQHISRKASQLNEFIMTSSLMLVNTHFTLNLPRPLVPNVIEVGGIHIGNTKPLPKGFAEANCPISLRNEEFQRFLKEDNKFDVMLAEFFNTNCFMGLAPKYKAPLIGLSTCISPPWIADWFGNPDNPAYIPDLFMDFSDQMTFSERIENTIALIYHKLVFYFVIDKEANELSEKFIGEDLYKGEHIIYNASLLLSNTHFSLTKPKPLVPAIIEVGGIHVEEPKALPLNLEKWINGSTDGVIYFSLGSMIKGNTFPKDKMEAFLKAFGRLPHRVLWKWENETMEGKPDNVMIQKWMPQLDILCHPNVKAFISHGGLLGTTEAVHCGVPVIVMPQFGDQHTNARALEASGGGVILQLSEATEDKVYKALKKVLSPGFRQKAKELSERFRDRPLPPLETAIYWVEYVARHRGAPHMRTAAVNMPFYKYYLIDVISFLLLVFSVFIYLTYVVIRLILRRVLKTNSGNTKVKTS